MILCYRDIKECHFKPCLSFGHFFLEAICQNIVLALPNSGSTKIIGTPICAKKMSNPERALKSPEHLHLNKTLHSASVVALNMVACQRSCQCTVSTWGFRLSNTVTLPPSSLSSPLCLPFVSRSNNFTHIEDSELVLPKRQDRQKYIIQNRYHVCLDLPAKIFIYLFIFLFLWMPLSYRVKETRQSRNLK